MSALTLRFAIFARDSHGRMIVLPGRYDTLRQAMDAWGYAVMDGTIRPQYIETVPCEEREY
jgi:hypothetical protein